MPTRIFLVLALLSLFLISCGGGTAENKTTKPADTTFVEEMKAERGETTTEQKPAPPVSSPRQQARLENELPMVKNARLETEGNSVHAVAEGSDADGDRVALQYVWFINDHKVDVKGDTVNGLNRGDRVQTTITPNDGKQDGPQKGLFVIVSNKPPKITPTEPEFRDPSWTLKVNASDPDGDPLQYSLVKAPPGMRIDPTNGVVVWNTEGVNDGKYSATVNVSDGHGGSAQYTYEVTLSQQ